MNVERRDMGVASKGGMMYENHDEASLTCMGL